jgi:hypothetical protein
MIVTVDVAVLKPLPDALRRFVFADWVRVAGWASLFAVAIAVPTRLVPNGWFQRMTPTRPQDYAFLIVTSFLAGVVVSLRHLAASVPQGTFFAGGIGTFLAVGCPVCNKLVVALVGVAGATSVFAPLQPLIGLASVALFALAAHRAAQAVTSGTCSLG